MIGYHLKRGGSFEIRCRRSRGWKNFGHRWTRRVEGLENWTIFMDVIRVSSLRKLAHNRKYPEGY